MLDRPPGGATILCVARRGMWSSTWVPKEKRIWLDRGVGVGAGDDVTEMTGGIIGTCKSET